MFYFWNIRFWCYMGLLSGPLKYQNGVVKRLLKIPKWGHKVARFKYINGQDIARSKVRAGSRSGPGLSTLKVTARSEIEFEIKFSNLILNFRIRIYFSNSISNFRLEFSNSTKIRNQIRKIDLKNSNSKI